MGWRMGFLSGSTGESCSLSCGDGEWGRWEGCKEAYAGVTEGWVDEVVWLILVSLWIRGLGITLMGGQGEYLSDSDDSP